MKLDFLGLDDAAELCFDSGFRFRNRFAAGRWQLGLNGTGGGHLWQEEQHRMEYAGMAAQLLHPSLTTSGHISEGVDGSLLGQDSPQGLCS